MGDTHRTSPKWRVFVLVLVSSTLVDLRRRVSFLVWSRGPGKLISYVPSTLSVRLAVKQAATCAAGTEMLLDGQ